MTLIKKGIFLGLIFNVFSYGFVDRSKRVMNLKPLSLILQEYPNISYVKVLDPYLFNYYPFFNDTYKSTGIFNECFIVTIPNGRVQGLCGHIFLNNDFIKELIWADNIDSLKSFIKISEDEVIKISSNVAVLAQPACDSYCHFMHEILGRLALLEMEKTEYDYVYVPILKPCMEEMLQLWGLDGNKIIVPVKNECCLEAEKLIVPSLVLNSDIGFVNAGFRPHPQTSIYVKHKLLKGALKQNIDASMFSKRVFISRNDAPQRKIINEDEVFKRFESYGFVSYELSRLSVAQQILLFSQADVVVGEHGAGLTNILFCKPETLVIELFQELIDNSNWWIANMVQATYVPVNCLDQDISWAANWKKNVKKYWNAWSAKTMVTLDKIDEIIEQHILEKD